MKEHVREGGGWVRRTDGKRLEAILERLHASPRTSAARFPATMSIFGYRDAAPLLPIQCADRPEARRVEGVPGNPQPRSPAAAGLRRSPGPPKFSPRVVPFVPRVPAAPARVPSRRSCRRSTSSNPVRAHLRCRSLARTSRRGRFLRPRAPCCPGPADFPGRSRSRSRPRHAALGEALQFLRRTRRLRHQRTERGAQQARTCTRGGPGERAGMRTTRRFSKWHGVDAAGKILRSRRMHPLRFASFRTWRE